MVAVNCLHHLIEARARRSPERPALAFEGRTLTYADLERRANLVARSLERLGAGPEARVALLVERSLDMVVAILGILKAGAAYVPIDPAYPAERVAFMLSDSGAALAVTQAKLLAALPPERPQTLCVDQLDWACMLDAPKAGAGADNLAYVIYTSGSTGVPKGVCIEHRNIVNYVLGIAERLRLEPGMQHAMVSTIAADLGNTVLFPALATGGCLHVISQERAEDGARLAEYVHAHHIDVMKIVPSHLAALQGDKSLMPARRLVLGGEASRLDWIERLRAAAPQCEIYNHYGPTETTVGVLAYRVGAELPRTHSGTLPLGKPLPGSRVYLLDAEGRRVAPGAKGELWIGGRGVARGYLNRPQLSAERFVPDPFDDAPGARLYRTGDLARELADGAIEFCGRIDHQVKLHGYRVELGEIEAQLKSHPGVQDAVVQLRSRPGGDPLLVACVAGEAAPAALREHLRERLPQYMVPSAFLRLEKLPLTANGKVDRQALAGLPIEKETGEEAVAPRSPIEQTLVQIWSELLGVEQVGIHDDLFDLGAHSLMAMKALNRIRDAFDIDLALRSLFERPTIGALAEAIDALALASRKPGGGGSREELLL